MDDRSAQRASRSPDDTASNRSKPKDDPLMDPRFTRAQLCAAAMTFATAILCGCASTPSTSDNATTTTALSSPAALRDGHYTLVVNGMSCPKCISNVEMQLTRIGGVTHPLVDMKNGFVTIDIVGGKAPSRESIAGAIADAGFTLVDVRGGVE